MRPVDWPEVRFFTRAEFVCSHCGEEAMQAPWIETLDKIRYEYGKPIIVTSGYRCPEYNAEISSTGRNGPHTTGFAVDISLAGGDVNDLLALAIDAGVTGIGLKQHGGFETRFVHLDMLKSEGNRTRPWTWTYS